MTTSAPLVFITGASSGIGQALAASFHDAGYRLALVARRTAEIEAWAKSRGLGADRYRVYKADVAQTDSIVAAGNDCIAQQGLPDVVIANAGISIGIDTAERADLDVLSQTFATNNVGLAATSIRSCGRWCSAAAAGWSASAALHPSAACPATGPTAQARPAWSRTARACAANCTTAA